MANNNTTIFDQIESEKQVTSNKNIFDQIEEETVTSPFESLGNFGKEFGVGFLKEAIHSPKSLSDFLKVGSEFLAQKGVEQKLKKGEEINPHDVRFTENVLKVLGFPSSALDYINYPSSETIENTIRDFGSTLGLNLEKPEQPSLAQERGKNIGEFTGGAVVGGPRKLLQRLFLGSIAGIGSQSAKELGFGEGTQFASSFALPVLVDIGRQIATKQFNPNSKELEELFNFGKNALGLTEEELVPLLQPEKKVQGLHKLAKPTEKTTKTFESIDKKLGQGFEQIKNEAKTLPKATNEQVNNLLSSFEETVKKLKSSDFPSNEKLSVIEKIDNAIEKIKKRGLTADSIIESYQDINKTVDWNKISGGKKQLAELQKYYKNILNDIDPETAKNFNKLNKLYTNFKNIEKKIGPDKYKKFIDYGKSAAVIGTISKAAATLDADTMASALTAYFGVELSRNIATKMLTDPKYQNILIKSANAVKNSSRSLGVKTFKELSDQISKDFPEEANKIDFKEFSKE